jgi:hypothetical protein
MRLGLVSIAVLAALAATDASARAATTCPATAPTLTAPARPGSGALAPTGATSVLLCRYHGLNPAATAHRLSGSRLVTAKAKVSRLLTELDALPPAPRGIHCPLDDGSELTARFAYVHAAAVLVTLNLTGCRTVTNGRVSRTASGSAGSRLIEQLSALVS